MQILHQMHLNQVTTPKCLQLYFTNFSIPKHAFNAFKNAFFKVRIFFKKHNMHKHSWVQIRKAGKLAFWGNAGDRWHFPKKKKKIIGRTDQAQNSHSNSIKHRTFQSPRASYNLPKWSYSEWDEVKKTTRSAKFAVQGLSIHIRSSSPALLLY